MEIILPCQILKKRCPSNWKSRIQSKRLPLLLSYLPKLRILLNNYPKINPLLFKAATRLRILRKEKKSSLRDKSVSYRLKFYNIYQEKCGRKQNFSVLKVS